MVDTKKINSNTILHFSLGPSKCCHLPCQYLSQSDERIHCSQAHCFHAWAAHYHRHPADLSQSGCRPPSQVPHRPTRSEVGIINPQNNNNLITTALEPLKKFAWYLDELCVFYSAGKTIYCIYVTGTSHHNAENIFNYLHPYQHPARILCKTPSRKNKNHLLYEM